MNKQTLSDYLEQQSALHQDIDADLRGLITTVAQACTKINAAVSQGALAGVLGSLDTENVQGEVQKKLDVLSNDILLQECEPSGYLTAMASEEMDTVYNIGQQYTKGPYLLLFDPLDGSSNIDVNVSIGTIFSILPATDASGSESSFLQPGTKQRAAGYAIYGPQTMLVLSLGYGVVSFTLDHKTGNWYLTKENIQIPEQTKEFAINMSNMRHWDKPVQRYVDECLQGETGPLGKNYNMRWIASMVADVHRVLSRGGIFMYPSDARTATKNGKLRLMYEANPMSFLVEQAGGLAINGTARILSSQPAKLHQRISVILGSSAEVKRVQQYHLED